jgi:hypothetical protein
MQSMPAATARSGNASRWSRSSFTVVFKEALVEPLCASTRAFLQV